MKQSLFRSIRMKLLLRRQGSEGHVISGKLLRYLTYALGEILLIVVGIMLALQLNNWNEDRKDQKAEMALLKSMRVVLENDRGLIEKYVVELERAEASNLKLQSHLAECHFALKVHQQFAV